MAEAELEQIKQAARMIKGVENITVIDSFVVDKNDFLKAYKISRESGALYHDPAISGTVYQTEMGNKVLYGNQSTDGKMQLYSVSVCWTAGASPNLSRPLMNREM